MPQQIQLRNGTAATWTAANPTLAIGEVGVETDTKKHKIGDGATLWNALAYPSGGLFTGGTLTSAINNAPIVTLASAATVAIGAAAGNAISITGTTTITAFDSIASGALRQLTFAGALTWTHNAVSMILPSGANIVTAAGDSAWVVSLGGGNWRALDFARASGVPLVASPAQNSLTPASSTVAPTVDAVNAGLATKAPSTGIANAALATMPANTGKFNLTGSAAVPTDATLASIEAALATVRSPGGSLKESFLNGVSSIALPTTGSTTIQGVGISTAMDGTATARNATLSGRSEYYVVRVGIVAPVTTANAEIGFRTSANVGFVPGSDAQTMPLVIKVRAVPSDAIASAARTAIGLCTSTPPLNTINPSAHTNCIMLAADDTDTQMFVMHNDGTGTCVKVPLNGGTGFPANSNSTQDYSFYVKMLGGTTRTATWVATNHVSNLVVTGTITGADLPLANIGVLAVARRGNSANTGIAPAIDFVGFAAGGFAETSGGGGGGGTWGSITGTVATQTDLLPFVDPVVAAAETVARAVVIADDRQTVAVDMATTAAYTLAAGVGLLRGVDFLQLGTGSITLTVGAAVTVNGVLGSVTPTRTLTTIQYTGASLIKLAAADTFLLM